MVTPTEVSNLYLEATCVTTTQAECRKMMKHSTRANKRQVDRLVKKHIPELYEALALNLYNPYNYFKTTSHLILVHSGIEYFLRYE